MSLFSNAIEREEERLLLAKVAALTAEQEWRRSDQIYQNALTLLIKFNKSDRPASLVNPLVQKKRFRFHNTAPKFAANLVFSSLSVEERLLGKGRSQILWSSPPFNTQKIVGSIEALYPFGGGEALVADFWGLEEIIKRGKDGNRHTNTNRVLHGSASIASKIATAHGSQTAVVKLISYGSANRLSAAIDYLEKDDRAVLENEKGQKIEGEKAKAAEIHAWYEDRDFERTQSKDVAGFSLSLEGSDQVAREEALKDFVALEMGERPYAYDIFSNADLTVISVVVVTYGYNEQGKVSRILTNREARMAFCGRIKALEAQGFQNSSIFFKGTAHGKDGAAHMLREFKGEGVLKLSSDGSLIRTEQDIMGVADSWRTSLHSYTPRDFMHVMLSSRPGTDREAFEEAGRAFLHEAYPNRQFLFGVHEDRSHVHIHAIVKTRDLDGKQIRVDRNMLRSWRTIMAGKAREQGIDMVAGHKGLGKGYSQKEREMAENINLSPEIRNKAAQKVREVDEGRYISIENPQHFASALKEAYEWNEIATKRSLAVSYVNDHAARDKLGIVNSKSADDIQAYAAEQVQNYEKSLGLSICTQTNDVYQAYGHLYSALHLTIDIYDTASASEKASQCLDDLQKLGDRIAELGQDLNFIKEHGEAVKIEKEIAHFDSDLKMAAHISQEISFSLSDVYQDLFSEVVKDEINRLAEELEQVREQTSERGEELEREAREKELELEKAREDNRDRFVTFEELTPQEQQAYLSMKEQQQEQEQTEQDLDNGIDFD